MIIKRLSDMPIKSSSPKVCVARITGDIARDILKRNTQNRRMRPSHVNYLARQMKIGNWVYSGQATVIFFTDGTLANGQHTLMATAKTDTTITTVVSGGVPLEAREVMDCGVMRTMSDLTGQDQRLVAIVRSYNTHFILRAGHMTKISAAEWAEVYRMRAIHFDFAARNKPKDKGIGMALLWAAMAYYHEYDAAKACAFAESIKSPVQTLSQTQILTRYLMTHDIGGGKNKREELLGRMLYCMNAHYRGNEISRCMSISVDDAFA